jgi:DNA-binding MarR family transcriptional regulator
MRPQVAKPIGVEFIFLPLVRPMGAQNGFECLRSHLNSLRDEKDHPRRKLAISIASRYNTIVRAKVTAEKYRALAELRYNILRFLHDGDAVARKAGLLPQQYLMLLAIRGLPLSDVATIRTLAERVALKHHSVVELVDRLEKHGYVRRNREEADRRLVTVSLRPKGERLLEEVVRHRVGELQAGGHRLVKVINRLLVYPPRPQNRDQAGISLQRRVRDKRG